MPDLIRHPVSSWIPAFAGTTTNGYLTAGVIIEGIQTTITEKFSERFSLFCKIVRKRVSVPADGSIPMSDMIKIRK